MSVLCTICARGGSRGVRNKNIRKIAGKPLIAHTIIQALRAKFIDKVIVSTDSEKIAGIARQFGAEVPFKRPSYLASDRAAKPPVVKHALRYCIEKLRFLPDIVIDLDPTSPLRSQRDIKTCFDAIKRNSKIDLVITGYRSNKNPYFNMVEIDKNGFAKLSKTPVKQVTRRQDAPGVYAMNAAVYAWRTEKLLSCKNIFSGNVKLIEMPAERSVDIDSEIDFAFVKFMIEKE